MISNQFFKLTLLFVAAFTCGFFLQDSAASSNKKNKLILQKPYEKTAPSIAAILEFSETAQDIQMNLVYTPVNNISFATLEWKIVRGKTTAFQIEKPIQAIQAGKKYSAILSYEKGNLRPGDLIVARIWSLNKAGEKIGILKNYRYQKYALKAAGAIKKSIRLKLPKKVFF